MEGSRKRVSARMQMMLGGSVGCKDAEGVCHGKYFMIPAQPPENLQGNGSHGRGHGCAWWEGVSLLRPADAAPGLQGKACPESVM